MNKIFSEATTGIAFVLTLTKRQCNTLLRLHSITAEAKAKGRKPFPAFDQEPGRFYMDFVASHPMPSLHALRDRGLVYWRQDSRGNNNSFAGLTKAGELMGELLIEAGLTIENTNTLSVLKRLAA